MKVQRSMFRRLALTAATTLLSVLLASAACIAAEFSADMVQKSNGKSVPGKLYVKGSKLRQDITNAKDKKETVIFRPDQNAVYAVDPAKKTYMKVSQRYIVGVDDPSMRAWMKKNGVLKKLGTEKVNGYTCNRLQWTTRGNPTFTLTEWVSDKLKIPVKTELKGPGNTVLIEYKNIKEAKVSDSIFDLPKGYKRIQTPTAPKNVPKPGKK